MKITESVRISSHPVSPGRTLMPLCLFFLFLCTGLITAYAEEESPKTSSSLLVIAGQVYDRQGQPVEGASIRLFRIHDDESIADATSQKDGHYVMELS